MREGPAQRSGGVVGALGGPILDKFDRRFLMVVTDVVRALAVGSLLLGGTPFGSELVMWWNFIGRSHEEIVAFRQLWQDGDERFGAVDGYRGRLDRLPAPPMPPLRLRPRS